MRVQSVFGCFSCRTNEKRNDFYMRYRRVRSYRGISLPGSILRNVPLQIKLKSKRLGQCALPDEQRSAVIDMRSSLSVCASRNGDVTLIRRILTATQWTLAVSEVCRAVHSATSAFVLFITPAGVNMEHPGDDYALSEPHSMDSTL